MDSIKKLTQGVDSSVFYISAAFIGVFCLWAVVDLESLSAAIDRLFGLSVKYLGLYWQVLLLLTFVIGLVLCFFKGSAAKMGATDKPEFTSFQWGSMILCTLLAGGGVFWAAGEPMAHFLSAPPIFSEANSMFADDANVAAWNALTQSYVHWGFLAWAILGALTAPMLMYYHYEKGLPLAPRTLLYPVFKDKAINGPIGTIADVSCIIAVIAGTVGPIGFLGLQVSFGLNSLFNIPDGIWTQALIIIGLMAVYMFSAYTGLTKGIKILSKFNIILVVVLLVYILIFGSTAFILEGFFKAQIIELQNFFGLTMFRGDDFLAGDPWLGWWTVFFWGWFLGYGPIMAIFIARISRGRSIRSIIIMLAIVAPIVTKFWFTIVGGTGLFFEISDPGSISAAFEGFNLPAALIAITQSLPAGFFVTLLFLVLTITFVATTGDSMTYTLAASMSKDKNPNTNIRMFWGLVMGVMAIILVVIGGGSIGKLQSFIVITAVPVSFILLPSLWDCARIVIEKSK